MNRLLLLVLAMMLVTTPAAQGQKLSQLTEDTAPTSDDIMETTNSPGGTPASRKVTLANLPKALLQSIANGHLLYNNNGVFGMPTMVTPISATNGSVSVAGLSSMGTANYMLRVNSGATAWEYRSPAQVLGDIGALTTTIPGSGTELPYRVSSTSLGASGISWTSGSTLATVAGQMQVVDPTASGPNLAIVNAGGSTALKETTNGRMYYGGYEHIFGSYDLGTEHVTISSVGYLGIGSAPSKSLTVYKSSSPTMQLVNSTTGSAAGDGTIFAQNGNDLNIQNQESAGSSVFVAVSSSQVPLTVSLAAAQAADAVQVTDSGGTVVNAINSTGGGRIGTASVSGDITGIVGSPRFTVSGNNAAHCNTVNVATSTNAYGARIDFFKTRDTDTDADAIVNAGDSIMTLTGYGADGASYRSAAAIFFKVDGTPGASDMPGSITFETSPDGSYVTTERMKIANDGVVSIGNTASAPSIRADASSTAGDTRLLVYDVDNGTLERVTVGAADSGGVGYKVLRISN